MNSQEIAQLAGVSRSTVSRVLNNYSNVPEETKAKVQKVIDTYGYTPNLNARALAGRPNDIIELVIADIDESNEGNLFRGINSPYFLKTVSSIIFQAKKKGQKVLVNIITNKNELKEIISDFKTHMIMGGIFVGFPYKSPEIDEMFEEGYNIITVDSYNKEEVFSHNAKAINSDNFEGGRIATNYLIEKGHTKIGFIEGDSRLSALERKNGFLSAMSEHGLSILPHAMVKGYYREESAYQATKELLDKCKEITALFCSNDLMAVGVAKALKERGLVLGKDISVIGFDNHDLSHYFEKKLTSVFIDLDDVYKLCLEGLFTPRPFIKYCKPEISIGETVKQL